MGWLIVVPGGADAHRETLANESIRPDPGPALRQALSVEVPGDRQPTEDCERRDAEHTGEPVRPAEQDAAERGAREGARELAGREQPERRAARGFTGRVGKRRREPRLEEIEGAEIHRKCRREDAKVDVTPGERRL